jgi:VanZ family protein
MPDARRRRALLFVAWIAVVFAFSSLPRTTLERWNPGVASWAGHFLEYALLGWFWHRWREVAGGAGWTSAGRGVLLAAGIAVADELYQSLIPGRVPDVLDGLVDLVGFAGGCGIAALLARRRIARRGARASGTEDKR